MTSPGRRVTVGSHKGVNLDARLGRGYNKSRGCKVVVNVKEPRKSFSLDHLPEDVKITLILPEMNDEKTFLAPRLRPRFIFFNDNEYKDVVTVLKKMLKYHIIYDEYADLGLDAGRHGQRQEEVLFESNRRRCTER